MSTTKTSTNTVQPYLFFEGICEAALEFYRTAVGAEIEMMMRFKDSPEQGDCGGSTPSPDKVMHASFRIGDTVIMGSDGRCTGKPDFQGFALSISAPTEAEADRIFNALSQGGQVVMPLAKTFYSPRFGMVTDRFGIMWMVIVPEK